MCHTLEIKLFIFLIFIVYVDTVFQKEGNFYAKQNGELLTQSKEKKSQLSRERQMFVMVTFCDSVVTLETISVFM